MVSFEIRYLMSRPSIGIKVIEEYALKLVVLFSPFVSFKRATGLKIISRAISVQLPFSSLIGLVGLKIKAL